MNGVLTRPPPGTTGWATPPCPPPLDSHAPWSIQLLRVPDGQEPGWGLGGAVSTVGTYSSNWRLPSNVLLATRSRETSG